MIKIKWNYSLDVYWFSVKIYIEKLCLSSTMEIFFFFLVGGFGFRSKPKGSVGLRLSKRYASHSKVKHL